MEYKVFIGDKLLMITDRYSLACKHCYAGRTVKAVPKTPKGLESSPERKRL